MAICPEAIPDLFKKNGDQIHEVGLKWIWYELGCSFLRSGCRRLTSLLPVTWPSSPVINFYCNLFGKEKVANKLVMCVQENYFSVTDFITFSCHYLNQNWFGLQVGGYNMNEYGPCLCCFYKVVKKWGIWRFFFSVVSRGEVELWTLKKSCFHLAVFVTLDFVH